MRGKWKKGFDRPQEAVSNQPVIKAMDRVDTTVDRLDELLERMYHYKLSPRAYGTMKKLAYMEPAVRLVYNLKTVLERLRAHDVKDVLRDGLTPDERETLIEIDSSPLTAECRCTAHSLMNIWDRMALAQAFADLFRDMRTRKQHSLAGRPLD